MGLIQVHQASEPGAQSLPLEFLTSVSEGVDSLQTVRSKMVLSVGGSLSIAEQFWGGAFWVRVLPVRTLIRRQKQVCLAACACASALRRPR